MIKYAEELNSRELIIAISDYVVQSGLYSRSIVEGFSRTRLVDVAYPAAVRDCQRLYTIDVDACGGMLWAARVRNLQDNSLYTSSIKEHLDDAYQRAMCYVLYPDGFDCPD